MAKQMTSRERVFCALEHKQPDRCPVDFWAEGGALQTLQNHFGAHGDELLDILGVDLQFVFPRRWSKWKTVSLPDGSWIDESGAHCRMVKNQYTNYCETVTPALANMKTIDEIVAYERWPDADNCDYAHFSEELGNLNEKRVLKLHAGGLYEKAWTLRGQEQYLMDMILNPDIPHYIMEKICNYWCEFVRRSLEAAGDKIDIVYTFDDIATQSSLIMSPEMLEEFVYPYHRRLNAVIKSYDKKILYHSCGSVVSQIENLKNLPIDILNPLQPLAAGMDFQHIKDRWGDSLCFHGGIDIQKLLPTGSPEEVKEGVRKAISVLGKDGGYIMTSAHYIQNDTPVENIIAMYDPSLR